MKNIFIVLILLSASLSSIWASNFSRFNDDTTHIKNQFLAYPIVFYLPETHWGAGSAGYYNFRFKNESSSSNPSQLQFDFSITQNRQVIMTLPFELYRGGNKWKFKGELSYYKYQYNFFGTGINDNFRHKETFRADYPRLRLDVLRRFNKIFAGIRYRFDKMKITDKKENGLLDHENLTGKKGGTISGIGLVAQWDTRDYIYFPTKGIFLQSEIFINDKFTGSDFRYQRYSLDLATYIQLKENNILAFNLYTATIAGNPIFYDLLFFGSPRLMRGFQDRRFLDKDVLVLQSEYRFPIYKKVHGVCFASTGTVAHTYSDLLYNPYKLSYGLGLRYVLNEKDRVRLRMDYGRTLHEGGAFYITINDAF